MVRTHVIGHAWIAILIGVISLSSCGIQQALQETEAAKDLEISTPQLHRIPDGTYHGSYSAGLTSAKTAVVISAGTITDLQLLEHDHGRGSEAESIIDIILQEQRIDVDTISGATISSKVIQKSVELALTEEDSDR